MELLRGAKNYLLGSSSSGGALDVVVVRLPDGTYVSSPFHVRVERKDKPSAAPQQRWVRLKVNGSEVSLRMKLGAAGEAFFVEPATSTLNEEASGNTAADALAPPGAWTTSPLSSPGDAASRRIGGNGSSKSAAEAAAIAVAMATATTRENGAAAKLVESRWGEDVQGKAMAAATPGVESSSSAANADAARLAAAALAAGEGTAAAASEGWERATSKEASEEAATIVTNATNVASVANVAPSEADGSWWWSWAWGGLPVRKDDSAVEKKRKRRVSGGGSIDETAQAPRPADLSSENGAAADSDGLGSSSTITTASAAAAPAAAAAAASGSDGAAVASGVADAAGASTGAAESEVRGALIPAAGERDGSHVQAAPRNIEGRPGLSASLGEGKVDTAASEGEEHSAVGAPASSPDAARKDVVAASVGADTQGHSSKAGAGAVSTPAESGGNPLSEAQSVEAHQREFDSKAVVAATANGANVALGDQCTAPQQNGDITGDSIEPSAASSGASAAAGAPAVPLAQRMNGAAADSPQGAGGAGGAATASPQDDVGLTSPINCASQLPGDAVSREGATAAGGAADATVGEAAAADVAGQGVTADHPSPTGDPSDGCGVGTLGAVAAHQRWPPSALASVAEASREVSVPNDADSGGLNSSFASDGDSLGPLANDGGGANSVAGHVFASSGGSGSGGSSVGSGFNRNISMDFTNFHTPCGSALDLPAIAAASEAKELSLAAAVVAAAKDLRSQAALHATDAVPLPLLSLCGLESDADEAMGAERGERAHSGGVGAAPTTAPPPAAAAAAAATAAAAPGHDFMDHLVTWDTFSSSYEDILSDPRLVVCIGGSLYPFRTALPALVAIATFGRALPIQGPSFAAPPDAAAASWIGAHVAPDDGGHHKNEAGDGGEGKESDAPSSASAAAAAAAAGTAAEMPGAAARSRRWLGWLPPLRGSSMDRTVDTPTSAAGTPANAAAAGAEKSGMRSDVGATAPVGGGSVTPAAVDASTLNGGSSGADAGCSGGGPGSHHYKSLRPTCAQLEALHLHEGLNVVEFESEDGAAESVVANVFLWESDARIVAVDIDGAVASGLGVPGLASFVPVAGPGVDKGTKKLLWGVAANGYKLVYFSSRPPTLQARHYVKFAPATPTTPSAAAAPPLPLPPAAASRPAAAAAASGASGATTSAPAAAKSVQQTVNPVPDGGIPSGPVLCTPEALLPGAARPSTAAASAAEAKAAFVTAALQNLAQLFPAAVNPLYAGLGADVTEALAFRNCGVPSGRALVCKSGELRGLNRTFRRSAESATAILDEIFPPLRGAALGLGLTPTGSSNGGGGSGSSRSLVQSRMVAEDAFGDSNFWREPLAIIHSDGEDG